MYDYSQIRYWHRTYYPDNIEKKMTLAYKQIIIKRKKYMLVGVAYCSEKDSFSRKIGRELAEQRLVDLQNSGNVSNKFGCTNVGNKITAFYFDEKSVVRMTIGRMGHRHLLYETFAELFVNNNTNYIKPKSEEDKIIDALVEKTSEYISKLEYTIPFRLLPNSLMKDTIVAAQRYIHSLIFKK